MSTETGPGEAREFAYVAAVPECGCITAAIVVSDRTKSEVPRFTREAVDDGMNLLRVRTEDVSSMRWIDDWPHDHDAEVAAEGAA